MVEIEAREAWRERGGTMERGRRWDDWVGVGGFDVRGLDGDFLDDEEFRAKAKEFNESVRRKEGLRVEGRGVGSAVRM
jgi:hypothetical protein